MVNINLSKNNIKKLEYKFYKNEALSLVQKIIYGYGFFYSYDNDFLLVINYQLLSK